MRQKKFLALAILTLSLVSSGCALFLFGAGAAGGIAISEDEIEGYFDKPFDRVYKASREVLTYEGFIRKEDRPKGILEAEVRKSEVRVTVRQITEKTVQLRIKARKAYKVLPDPELANELYNKVFKKL